MSKDAERERMAKFDRYVKTEMLRLKDLSTPIIDAARQRMVDFDRLLEVELARSSHWYQWRYWRYRYWEWRHGWKWP
jgi:hypothetical protein